MTAAIIAIFIFFLGTMQIFVWFNHILVGRQQYYESSRLDAASSKIGEYKYAPEPLGIFPQAAGGDDLVTIIDVEQPEDQPIIWDGQCPEPPC